MRIRNISTVRFLDAGYKKLFLTLLLFLGTLFVSAQEKKNKNVKYEFEVRGNCEQCQKRIQKAALTIVGVKSAVWDMESHTMTVIINEEKCVLLDVKKAIAKIGHDNDEVKASDEVYENLNNCCKYERD